MEREDIFVYETDGLYDYKKFYKARGQDLENIDIRTDRFVPMGKRTRDCDWSPETMKMSCEGKYMINWKGIERMKDAEDLMLYEHLIWEVKPKTIIELGTAQGGTALWMADLLKIYGIDGTVYTVDIDPSLIHPAAREADNLKFIEGDSTKLHDALMPEMLKNLPHPWIVVEDCHINVYGVLEYFHKYLTVGDYWIIDDTAPGAQFVMGQNEKTNKKEFKFVGPQKEEIIEEFFKKYSVEYAVDTKYTDWFGYNGTQNMNGYIKRIH